MNKIKFGSVCSGIEAASVAWQPLGWEAAWLSEIEPFPSAVLAHHYPTVPNLGDMTTLPERILSGEVEAPDVFCGGTPCQAFSVAGLRNSLDDARGNLSLTFVGIANAIDHVRSVRGEPASIVFWENVPGVLSTKDNAFGCFLAGLAGEDNPLEPPRGKWTNSGYVLGPKRAVAWRILDAQYFGVAQRRRRVFVVASARDNFDPAAVLFEFDGVRRDTAPSREKGQAIAPCVTNGPPFSRTGNERVEADAMVVSRSHWDGDYPHPTLNQSARSSGGVGSSNQEIFSQRGAYLAPHLMACRKVALGEYSDDGVASTMKARDYKEATDLVAQTFSIPAIGHIVQDDVAGTMTRHTGSGAGETQNPAFVAQPIALQDITPREKAQNGRGWNDDGTAYTVDTHATQGVAQPIAFSHYRTNASPGEMCPTLQVSKGGGAAGAAVAQPITFSSVQSNQGINADLNVSQTLEAKNPMAVAQPIDFRNLRFHEGDVAGTMQAKSSGGYSLNYETGVMQPMVLMDQGGSVMNVEHDMVGTLRRETHGHEPVVMQPMAFDAYNQTQSDTTAALRCAAGGVYDNTVAQPIVAMRESGLGYWMEDTVAGTLDANMGMSGHANRPAVMTVPQAMAVRRLTPVECERLQGFPDNYTNIPWRKKDESPDGPRYKALGNSWAVPNVRWIGQRIQKEIEKNDL
jgi:DNA (cytosine-5)-methyltransferase 1